MPGPIAFSPTGKKVQNRPGRIPLSLSGRLRNWVYCMCECQKEAGVQQEPDLGPSQGELRSSSTCLLPRGRGLGASWGRSKGLKINMEVFSDSRQVMHFYSIQKKKKKS